MEQRALAIGVSRLDRATAGLENDELLASFDAQLGVHRSELLKLAIQETAQRSAVEALPRALSEALGIESIDFETGTLKNLLDSAWPAKYLNVVLDSLDLDPQLRAAIIERWTAREYAPPAATGPSPPIVPVHIHTDNKSPSRARTPAEPSRPANPQTKLRNMAAVQRVSPYGTQ